MIILKSLWALWLVFVFALPATAQFSKYEGPDVLLESGSPPTVNKNVCHRLEEDDAVLYFACYFRTDTSGKVIGKEVQPLYHIGNEYQSEDSIWRTVASDLARAFKEWEFRPYRWKFDDEKALAAKINKNPYQRPFGGRTRFLVIYEISGSGGSSIDKLSFARKFEVAP